MIIENCIACNSNISNFTKRTYLGGYKLNLNKILTCNHCSLSFVSKNPDLKKIENFYYSMKSNFLLYKIDKEKVSQIKAKQFGTVLKILFENNLFNKNEKSKILDIGPGNGNILKQIDDLTLFEGLGIEPDQIKCKTLKLLNLNYINNSFENVSTQFNDETFKYIIISHVFEHLLNPIKNLKEMYRILKTEGFIYFEVPNCNENYFSNRVTDSLGHLYFFNKTSLEHIFNSNGFEVIQSGSIGNRIEKLNFSKKMFIYIINYFQKFINFDLLKKIKNFFYKDIKIYKISEFKKNDDFKYVFKIIEN